jgi:hypothetical protein
VALVDRAFGVATRADSPLLSHLRHAKGVFSGPDYRHSNRQKPERARARPKSLFFARRVIRLGFPEASVSMSLATRAPR